ADMFEWRCHARFLEAKRACPTDRDHARAQPCRGWGNCLRQGETEGSIPAAPHHFHLDGSNSRSFLRSWCGRNNQPSGQRSDTWAPILLRRRANGSLLFSRRLGELGWVEGRTVAIDVRWAEGRNERFAEIAAEFARLKVDVIVTAGTAAIAAAKQA